MIMRALDSNHDWTFGHGRNNYLSANAEIMQDIQTRLLSFLGDCFFAIGDGIDWFTFLGGKDSLSLQLAVRAVILNTGGVQSLISSSVITNDQFRTIGMNYTVTTIYSASNNTTTTVSGSILLPLP